MYHVRSSSADTTQTDLLPVITIITKNMSDAHGVMGDMKTLQQVILTVLLPQILTRYFNKCTNSSCGIKTTV